MGFARVKGGDDTVDERAGVLHHVYVNEHKACFGRLGIKTVLEGADESKVVVL